ncbi:hypothetical protein [Aquamicrobium zhengzhouense]|uniref:Uncharacterized protein n=1 Tax=Aquamicrobium zhengzhouense TaxID=2781738 RepID=A0ABS0SGZ6_9HYPH|nr:hypothetical protein [Aquamicrobium zhengzhouense]MBI1622580.1 hypothetical protein [Aquamicrobium zhengzhouense]
MKTAVETIFIGKDRRYNRRFLQMCSHSIIPAGSFPFPGFHSTPTSEQSLAFHG